MAIAKIDRWLLFVAGVVVGIGTVIAVAAWWSY